MIPITLLYAGILGLLSVLLANQVMLVRVKGKSEESWRAHATERVQANFVENVPLAVLLLFIFEFSSGAFLATHLFGVFLVLFRLLHAWGMSKYEGANYPRLIGAQGTFLLISILSFSCIYQAVLFL
ncbi:MAG: MAPEG family protein [SAR86 cluster bacterium]|nr:MAPEG family protein [SAR86 cluster bacterium]